MTSRANGCMLGGGHEGQGLRHRVCRWPWGRGHEGQGHEWSVAGMRVRGMRVRGMSVRGSGAGCADGPGVVGMRVRGMSGHSEWSRAGMREGHEGQGQEGQGLRHRVCRRPWGLENISR